MRERQAQRLLYYEKLFFVLDNDGAGYVDGATADRFLSFVAFELDAPTRRRRILEAVSFDLDAAALAAERMASASADGEPSTGAAGMEQEQGEVGEMQ